MEWEAKVDQVVLVVLVVETPGIVMIGPGTVTAAQLGPQVIEAHLGTKEMQASRERWW